MTKSYEDDRGAALNVADHVGRLNDAIQNAWSIGLDIKLSVMDVYELDRRHRRPILAIEISRPIVSRGSDGVTF